MWYHDYMSSRTRVFAIGVSITLMGAVVVRVHSDQDLSRQVRAASQPLPVIQKVTDPPSPPPLPKLPSVRRYRDPVRREVHYTITRIDTTAPEESCHLNNRGDVLADNVYYRRGRDVELPNESNDRQYNMVAISGINDLGDAVGDISGSSSGAYMLMFSKAVVWHNRHMRIIAPSSGDSEGMAINNRGEILINFPDQQISTFSYSAGVLSHGKMRDFGSGRPCCMNNVGSVVVNRAAGVEFYNDVEPGHVVGNRKAHLFAIRGDVKYAIDTPSSYVDSVDSVADINDSDDIVGDLETGGSGAEAFVWSRGRMTVLGSFGGDGSRAGGINNQGEVVGWADTDISHATYGGFATRAFLYKQGRLHDLNHYISSRSGWVLMRAWDINNRGQIVCGGNKGLCLLTPNSLR